MKKILTIFLSLLLLSGCATENKTMPADISITADVTRDEEFGGIYIELQPEDLEELGISYGDGVDISLSNGYSLENIPYYSGYYGKTGETVLLYYQGYPYIKVQICQGDSIWDLADVKDGDSAIITLAEKEEYLDIQNSLNMSYSNDITTYPDNASFANFRVMNGGDMASNLFYRGASVDDNRYLRAATADELLKENNIQFILNLADSEDNVKTYIAADDFNSPYFLSLYEEGKVLFLGLGMTYRDEAYKEKLVSGFKVLMESEGPYYIHCTEGKDRTGFVCILIECIGGCSIDEIENDYMKTYENYYGITESDEEKYAALLDVKFDDIMLWLEDVKSHDDLYNINPEDGAKNYLLSAGMSEEEYATLKSVITGK